MSLPTLIHVRMLHLGRGENEREHPFVKAKRVKQERGMVWQTFFDARHRFKLVLPVGPPWWVRFTRIAPSRGLDSDNLITCLKNVRDQTAICLGMVKLDKRGREVAMDGPGDPIRFKYHQETGEWGVRIEIGDAAWFAGVEDVNSPRMPEAVGG